MLGLPKTTELSRILNKDDILKNATFKNVTKAEIGEKIERIRIVNVLNSKTLNVSAGEIWKEIDVIGVSLRANNIEDEILKSIDGAIPRPIVYVVKNNFGIKLAIGDKEKKAKGVKIDTFFVTDWKREEDFELKIVGRDIDNVYANFIKQVAGDKLQAPSDAEESESEAYNSLDSAKADIEKMKEREKIQKQIDALTKRIKVEPSLGKQQELAEERYMLKRLLQ